MSPPTTGCGDVQLLTSKKPQSRDELIQTMGEGYIVHSVMGAHTANPTSGDFSVTTSTILRVEDGEIIEQGTHKDLTELKGAYYYLVRNQLELGA